jgi:hypothetical protein
MSYTDKAVQLAIHAAAAAVARIFKRKTVPKIACIFYAYFKPTPKLVAAVDVGTRSAARLRGVFTAAL